MALSVGSMAPDFTLKNSKMEEVTLSKFRGKPVLLLFMPLAFTPTCTKECAIVTTRLEDFQKHGAVFGITVDSPFSLAKWAEQEKYTIPLLSDLGKQVSQAYDTYMATPNARGLMGIAKRSSFLIDKNGKIVKVEVKETPGELPDLEGFMEAMKQLA